MTKLGAIYQQANDVKHSKFQYFMIVVISMTFFSHGGVPLLLTFLTTNKDWRCLTDRCNPDIPLCEQDLMDDDWYSPVSKANDRFLKKFGVYCGYEGYFSSIVSGLFAAFMVGIIIGGKLMDKYGRHKVTCIGVYLFCCSVLLHAGSSSDFRVFAGAQISSGFLSGITGAVFIYQNEMTVTSFRNIGIQVHTEAFSLGMLYGASLTYLLDDLTWICVWLMMPAFLFNTLIWLYIPESPFWLQIKGRNSKVVEVLDYVASFNGFAYKPEGVLIENENNSDVGSASVLKLFTFSTRTRRIMLTFMLTWLNAAFCFWSLSFNVGDLIGNIYTNQILISVLDLFNRPINYYLVKVMDRVKFLRICNAGMMISALLCMFPFTDEILPGFNLKKISALGGRFLSDFFFNELFLHTSELLPTEVRAAGLGVCSSAARIGSVAAPFVILANSISPNLIFMVILGLSSVCWVLYGSVPETKGKMLPDTLQDMDDMIRGAKKMDRSEI